MKNKPENIWDERFITILLDSLADGVFALDEVGKIISWNKSMERITGYTAEEALGKKCSILNFSRCFQNDCPGNTEECEIYRVGSAEAKECLLIHKDGYTVPVLKNAGGVTNENGSVIGVVETITDFTELKNVQLKVEEVTQRLGEMYKFDNIIGRSRPMQQVFSSIRAAAASDASVLIQGESGTGKELVSGAIHYNGERSVRPLVTVNCSALSESLLESELFGHVKGAFTGALRDRIGRFEEADGGTVFLDEISEISPMIQMKLLRVLQEREVERVGESRKRKIDIRIISATQHDLFGLVRQRRFREDLYYRLKVFPIQIPPLRQRKEDIPLLVDQFIEYQNEKTQKRIKRISEMALRILMDYPWPGNVRELENAIEHAFVLCTTDEIDLFDLPVEIRQIEYGTQPTTSQEFSGCSPPLKDQLTREKLIQLLHECLWNKAEAARRIGVSRTAVWKYMNKWEIPLKRPD
ncbi:MAG: sigma 54-interacting transcriptional regulator [Thermodesulfobacteriota bacterium]|nr:sigma 54-interacting transcriptional regulator [Thermodesulfobacteriota bacterium]